MDLTLCFHPQLLAVHHERRCLGLRGPCAVHHSGKSLLVGAQGLGVVSPATPSTACRSPPPPACSAQMACGAAQVHAACDWQCGPVGSFPPGSRSRPAAATATGTVMHVWGGHSAEFPRSRGTECDPRGPASCSAWPSAQVRLPHRVGAPASGQGAPSSGGGL